MEALISLIYENQIQKENVGEPNIPKFHKSTIECENRPFLFNSTKLEKLSWILC